MAVSNIISQYGQQGIKPVTSLAQGMQYGEQLNQARAQRERRNALERLGPGLTQGDPQAIGELAKLDPQMASQYQQQADQRNAEKRQSVASLMQMVENSPEQNKAASYDYARNYAVQNLGVSPDRIPEQYDPRYLSALKSSLGGQVPGASGVPSSIQEHRYFQNLPTPEARDEYLRVKRADPTVKYGDVPMSAGQASRTVQPYGEAGAAPRTQADIQERLSQQEAEKVSRSAAGKAAIQRSEEAFDQLGKVRSNISNYDEAIRLVREEGARTGPLVSRFPSLETSAVELDNLQARLGLDVIGNTTFGALSENELKFALQSALPKDLKGEALVDWLERRRSAQQKLGGYLEEAAAFLGTPGNTVADWIEFQKEKGGSEGGEKNEPDIEALLKKYGG